MATYYLSITNSDIDVTQQLNAFFSLRQRSDTAIVQFGAGTFYLSNAIKCKCSISMSGAGSTVTKILCDSSVSLTQSDSYITCYGVKNNEISVEIKNLEISLSEHSGTLWVGAERHLIKLVHANNVIINNIRAICSNAAITNLDMRVCSNIVITDSELINYNNCVTGGVIWVRRDTHNVTITRNRIVKYGNDEVLAFWQVGDDDSVLNPTSGIKENIIIANNDIIYEKPSWVTGSTQCDVMITLFNSIQNSANEYKNIHFVNNRIKLDAHVSCVFSFTIEESGSYHSISLINNIVLSTNNNVATSSHYTAFALNDSSQTNETVQLINNSFSIDAITTDGFGNSSTRLIHSIGGKLLVKGNTLTSPYYVENNIRKGTILYSPNGSNNKLFLYGNQFVGIKNIGRFTDQSSINDVTIEAEGNLFSGDTRIYCDNVSRADLKFNNNTFISQSFEMLLQEFASIGTLVFTNNIVDILFVNEYNQHVGRLFAHYSNTALSSMYFERFEVTGNTVRVLSESVWIISGLNCGTYIVNNNYYINP